jgi:rhodanese-related sulfurtransferase
MKKDILISLLFILISLSAASCSSTGYVTKDGTSLQKYLDPAVLKELTVKPNPDIWIIDLRFASLYKSDHIPTARSYPLTIIMDKLDEISKEKSLIVYCIFSPGAQSVVNKLEKAGYTKIMNWGAYSRWPYETEKSAK